MRTINRTSRFKRDYKRLLSGTYSKTIEQDMLALLQLLLTDAYLPEHYRDHSLTGEWVGFRDCHLHPDLVLIYRKLGSSSLELARIGSHSDLF